MNWFIYLCIIFGILILDSIDNRLKKIGDELEKMNNDNNRETI